MSIIDSLGGVVSFASFWFYAGILTLLAKRVVQASGIPEWSMIIALPVIVVLSVCGAAVTVRGMFALIDKLSPQNTTPADEKNAKPPL